MKSVLITGGSGLLGSTMMNYCSNIFEKIYYTYYKNEVFFNIAKGFRLDLCRPGEITSLFDSLRPDIIMHFAALTDSVMSQESPELALDINALAARNMAMAAEKFGARIVYMSSDFIFDGEKGSYTEIDPAIPLNVYSKSKLLGEDSVRSISAKNLIIRGTFYGLNSVIYKNAFLGKIISSLRQGVPLKMANDSYFTPLPVQILTKVILKLVIDEQEGTWHLGSTDTCSRYAFASQVASVFNLPCASLEETTHLDLQYKIQRPRDVSLDVTKASKYGIKLPTVRQGLQRYKEYWDKLQKGG